MEPAAREEVTPAPAVALERAAAAAPGEGVFAGAPLARRVLALQRSAGNAAVARAAHRRILARDAWPPGKEEASGYWKDQTPAELGKRVADDLLSDPKYERLAALVLVGGWIKYMIDSVEVVRQRGRLDQLEQLSKAWPRLLFVIAMVRDPLGFDSAATLAKLPPGGVPGDQVLEVESRRIDFALSQFATERTKLTDALNRESGDAGRKKALDALRAFDAKWLPGLEKITASRGPERWKHDDQRVEEAVLGAIGLRAADRGLSNLDRPSADVKSELVGTSDEPWCGFFATAQYRGSSFDARAEALAGSFASTWRVWAFFNYQYGAITGLFPKYIRTEDGSWMEVAKYHDEVRHSRRTWTSTSDIRSKAAKDLDIQPGDIVNIAVVSTDKRKDEDTPKEKADKEAKMNKEKGYGDHVVMAVSYDKSTGRLITIGGNDGGYVVRGGAAPATESASTKADREAREAATGRSLQVSSDFAGHVGVSSHDLTQRATLDAPGAILTHGRVAAIGRPSLVDFEMHVYSDDGVHVKTDPTRKK